MKPFALLIAFCPVFGSAVSFSDIQFWAGTGANKAAIVIDFNDSQSPRSYFWGFRWNGAASGEDALRAIVNADPNLDAIIDVYSFGSAVNTISYLPQPSGGYRHSRTQDFGPSGLYWSYWVTTENNSSWSFSNDGMSQRVLHNGDVDGWVFSNPNYDAPAPTTPVAAVPEPASLIVFGLGLILRRRHSGASATYKKS